jgi:hypothetical protein
VLYSGPAQVHDLETGPLVHTLRGGAGGASHYTLFVNHDHRQRLAMSQDSEIVLVYDLGEAVVRLESPVIRAANKLGDA